ncbi:hypothetical protein AgCh_005157 [Apium graveolens]
MLFAEHSVIPELQAEEGDLFWDDDYINPYIDHAFKHTSETEPVGDRDIIVEKKVDVNKRDIVMEKSDKVLERISSVHPSLMELQYPLLFPLGEDDYHDEIPYVDSENQNKKKRKRIMMKEYYAYRFQVRRNEGKV